MRYCRYCGKQVPDDAQFCPACGKSLASLSRKPSGGASTTTHEPLFRVTDRQGNHGDSSDPSEEDDQKKKSSLWGCTIFFILFAAGCVVAVFVYNSFFTGKENALIPKDDDTISVVADDEETATPINDNETNTDKQLTGEEILQRRVQKIYDDVLYTQNQSRCVGKYCTDALKVLISKAEATGEQWIDYNYWTYSNDCDNPKIEYVQIEDYSGYTATAKVAIRPYSDGQAVNIIQLKMEKENGEWLINDFIKNGRSVRSYAHIAAIENDILNNIDTLY